MPGHLERWKEGKYCGFVRYTYNHGSGLRICDDTLARSDIALVCLMQLID